jgi:catechol 2,3-dioxygenase-like lactoylglutathione lyase family enzyme
MLLDGKTVAFVPSSDLERSERFYVGTLGFVKKQRDDFAVVVEANGVTIRIARADGFAPQAFTILGFDVDDVDETARALAAKGIAFERYPGMEQDASGIWTAPSGSRIAWFKDADGNVLSIAEHPR